jgi:tRNA A-37 threonylcarbamoyl transferase component Bud32
VLVDGPPHKVIRVAAAPDGHTRYGQTAIIAKYYPDDEGERTARVTASVCEALGRSPGRRALGIPRVLGYDAQRRLLLQEPVPGTRYDAILSGPGALRALALAGRALAALHALDAAAGPPLAMRDHLRDLIHPHPARLARAVPALRPRLGRILRTLLLADAAWRDRRADVPIHRDVHPKQLFLDGRRVCLIDWDLSARGDAALDLGNFVAYLRARLHLDDAATGALTQGYAAAGAPDTLERVPVYEALTYVRLACKRFRLGAPGWRDGCAGLIGRAEQCLGLGRWP